MDKLGDISTAVIVEQKQLLGSVQQKKKFIEECRRYDADVAESKSGISKMISLLVAPGLEQDPETKTAIYWDILKGELSPENISKVCRSAMRGSVSGSKFLPTPGELISYANHWYQRGSVRLDPRLAPAEQRLAAPEHQLLSVIDNPVSEDERARIAHQFRRLASDFVGKVEPKLTVEENLAKLADQPMPQLSKRAKATLERSKVA